jgi:hypothetical protein
VNTPFWAVPPFLEKLSHRHLKCAELVSKRAHAGSRRMSQLLTEQYKETLSFAFELSVFGSCAKNIPKKKLFFQKKKTWNAAESLKSKRL